MLELTYDPEWWQKKGWTGRGHLKGRPPGHYGFIENQRTLCGKKGSKFPKRIYDAEDEVKCKTCERRAEKIERELEGNANVAWLIESSFQGSIAMAYHWSGTISLGSGHKEDLAFRLTYLQARKLNAEDPTPGMNTWEAGARSTRFFTREALRKAAVERIRAKWPQVKAILADRNMGRSLGPVEVIWAEDEEAEAELNAIWKIAEAAWRAGKDFSAYKPWRKIMKARGLEDGY